MLAAIGFIILMLVIGAASLIRRNAKPLAEAEATALDRAVRWSTQVHDAIAQAERDVRWLSRDQRLEWAASRPTTKVSPRARKRLAPAQRAGLDLISLDLASLASGANERIRERALTERKTSSTRSSRNL